MKGNYYTTVRGVNVMVNYEISEGEALLEKVMPLDKDIYDLLSLDQIEDLRVQAIEDSRNK